MLFGGVVVTIGLAFLAASGEAGADLDLILYGADGCVGHFAASHLAKQPNLKWAIAGRTRAHLEAVLDDLAKEGGIASKPEIIVAPLNYSVDPKTWVMRAKAVITAAGPFSIHGGEVLMKACAEAGVHYADTSDEFYWQRQMIDQYDAVAQRTSARIILSTGFCALAGDLGSQLALQSLGDVKGATVSLDAWLEIYNGGLSAGVINTGKAIKNASYPKEWDSDPYVLTPKVDADLRVDTKVEGMSYPRWVTGEGLVVANIFGPYDARLLRRSFVHLGQKVELRVGSATAMYPKWTAFLAEHPGSWTKLAKCPTQQVYNDGSWAYRFKASAGGKAEELLLSGKGDPGYHFTSWGLAEAGLCLAGKTAGCMKASAKGGVYTSMAALDPEAMQKRLESVGLVNFEKPTQSVRRTLVV